MKTIPLILALLAGQATAAVRTDPCSWLGDYYWEIGDATHVIDSGAVGTTYTRNTILPIFSASKWLYGAYAAEIGFAEQERPYLNLTSGYVSFTACSPRQTVASCAAYGTNGTLTPAAVGRFDYDGGHMQQHAARGPLGSLTAAQLGAEMSRVLGVSIVYPTPQIAGGASMSSAEYARFLQRLLRGELRLAARLGEAPVCTLPGKCPTALSSPTVRDWTYSIGHWVERDIDGAFSSLGAGGFYPWISADRTTYGLIATNNVGAALQAASCGAAMRWTRHT